MASNISHIALLAAIAAASGVVFAQDGLVPANPIEFNLPSTAPLRVDTFDAGDSRVTSRSGALMIDLHVVAKLRNTSGDTIRSITLLVSAQESTPGGKWSLSKASINLAPGETLTWKIDGRLMRPGQAASGPLARVSVDGVLFSNYEFYGPDRLNSRRQMVAWAMQGDRDRKYFKQVLASRGAAGLQQEMLDSINRQTDRPHLDVQLAARGRATTSGATTSPDRQASFTFLQMPESPIKPTSGYAEIAGNEARHPRIEIQNTSAKHVRYVEIAWLVKDMQGKEYLAGSLPASDSELFLPPKKSAQVLQDTSLRFSRNGGQPVNIQNMTGFVSEVEYSDHNVWIPTREDLKRSDLLRVMPPSFEEQHLVDLYRQGIDHVVRELNKF